MNSQAIMDLHVSMIEHAKSVWFAALKMLEEQHRADLINPTFYIKWHHFYLREIARLNGDPAELIIVVDR